jgi:hypothetical protein
MNKRAALSIFSTVVLGAVGSGLWEVVKPLVTGSWTGLLTLATLGLDTVRDHMYAQAAQTMGKPTGFQVVLSYALTAIFLTGTVVLLWIKTSFPHTASPLGNFLFRVLLCLVVASALTSVRAIYATNLAHYTAVLETMAAPHLTETELKRFRADAIRIANRDQYLKHVERLQKVIEGKGEQSPKRNFF